MTGATSSGPQPAVVVMGVAGSGKSTLAAAIAERLGAVFVEADSLHSADARARMAAGVPLTDDDRWPWLARVAARIRDEHTAGHAVVVACSALRRCYREVLSRDGGADVTFVHLDGSEPLLAERIGQRTGHFMPATMLSSQLATLEPLGPDERGHVVSIEMPIGEAADLAVTSIRRRQTTE